MIVICRARSVLKSQTRRVISRARITAGRGCPGEAMLERGQVGHGVKGELSPHVPATGGGEAGGDGGNGPPLGGGLGRGVARGCNQPLLAIEGVEGRRTGDGGAGEEGPGDL